MEKFYRIVVTRWSDSDEGLDAVNFNAFTSNCMVTAIIWARIFMLQHRNCSTELLIDEV